MLLLLPALQPAPTSNSLLAKEERRKKLGRGGGKPNSKPPGMNDPYGIDIAPLNVCENQIVPVGEHKLSKSFRPNMATILVLSLGSKFIPKWRDANLKFTFKKFEDKVITKQNVYFGNCTSTFCFETSTSKIF